MQITLMAIGKTDNKQLRTLFTVYEKRLKHYVKFTFQEFPDIKNTKNLSEDQQKKLESDLILKQLKPTDTLILLDERGKAYSSIAFAKQLQKFMNAGVKRLFFVIGGPYGFSEEFTHKADAKISLSNMTFSHQMVRLFFIEQLYRGFTILRNEPYHHQ